MPRPRQTAAAVAVGSLAATLAFIWPLPARFAGYLPGTPGDNMIFYWNIWWFREALWRQHRSPFHTPLLFHPTGADLAYHTTTLLGTIPGSLLALFVPLPVAFNIVFVACFALTAAVTWGLARHVLRRARLQGPGAEAVAIFAAAAYTFAPFHVAHIGHLNILNVAAVPLAAWMALRLHERPTPQRAVALGAALGAAAWADGYHALAASLLALILVLFLRLRGEDTTRLARRSETAPKAPAASPARPWQLAAIALGAFLVVALPVFVPMATYGTRGLEDVQAGGANEYVADLASYVLPSPFHPLWGAQITPAYSRLSGNRAENVVFPTFTVLLLAFAGWRRGGKEARLWLAVAAVFVVLTLGPFLHIAGASAIEPRPGTFWRLPLPKLWLDHLPLLAGARAAGRFASAGQLGLVIAAMLGLAALARAGTATPRRGILIAAIAGVAFECLAWPLPTTRIDVPPAYRLLAAEARSRGVQGALLEIPPAHSEDKIYQMYQTVHGLPLLGGRLARGPRHAYDRLHRDPFLDRTFSSDPWRANDGGLSLDGLDSLHVDYVMLHTRLAAAGAIARVLEPHFELVPSEGEAQLYRRRIGSR